MSPIPLYQVDSFTNQPFKGNPAGVCLLPEAKPERWMQDVASEMNLSETAFLVKNSDSFDLRWFTPRIEVDLCGHATLAAAHILWQTGLVPLEETIRFHTRSGLLTADKKGEWIELNFPARRYSPVPEAEGVSDALGKNPDETYQSGDCLLYVYRSEADIRALTPDFAALGGCGFHGVIVTAPAAAPGIDFISRFFAPAIGINEDPVTGSSHCTLAPYWRERLHQDALTGFQASARGGIVKVRSSADRVYLSGQAVTIFSTAIQE
jgi:PhzF family phenazine biosynthesis protein